MGGTFGFSYNWVITTSNGTVTNTSTTGQNITFSNPVFNAGEATIRVDYTLNVSNTTEGSCNASEISSFFFHRNPIINTITTRADNCEADVTLAPFGTETISGFTYNWIITTSNGTVTNTSTDDQNITLSNPVFNAGETTIQVDYTLNVSNTTEGSCNASEISSFFFHRNPIINSIAITRSDNCEADVTLAPFGTETISGFTYNWIITTSNGTVTNTSTTGQNITFSNPVFNAGEATIRVDYTLNVSNTTEGSCNASEISSFFFHRNPIINTITTRADNCEADVTLTTFWYWRYHLRFQL